MLKTLGLLLPVLFPSWRFFKEVAGRVRLDARVGDTEWQEVCARPPRLTPRDMVVRLFWNPTWNAQLYAWSCAERLSEEDSPELANTLREVACALTDHPPEQTTFCVVWIDPSGAEQATELIPPLGQQA